MNNVLYFKIFNGIGIDNISNNLTRLSIIILNLRDIRRMMMNNSDDVLCKKKFFFDAGKIMVQLAKRNQVSLLVAIVEIDNLATYDEKYGEGTANKLLELVSTIVTSKCRASDLITTIQDGKVGIVFYNITNANAKNTLESLYKHIENNDLFIKQADKQIDMYIGGTIMHNQLNGGTINSLFEQACIAVESLKKQGKNKVIVY